MKTNIIDIISRFDYFVGHTRNIHDEKYMNRYRNYTIYQPDEDSEEGTICGFVRKEETLLIAMTMGFYKVEIEDALTYLKTMN